MDGTERRFRARADRFRRDLNKIVFRAIDKMVDDALKDSAKKERVAQQAAAREARAQEAANQRAAKARRLLERDRGQAELDLGGVPLGSTHATASNKRSGKRQSSRPSAEQLELRLDASGALAKPKAPARVREDSILGAELKASIDLAADVASGVEAMFSGRAHEAPGPTKQPTDRPLFVHKRARDGRIHALRRGETRSQQTPPAANGSPEGGFGTSKV